MTRKLVFLYLCYQGQMRSEQLETGWRWHLFREGLLAMSADCRLNWKHIRHCSQSSQAVLPMEEAEAVRRKKAEEVEGAARQEVEEAMLPIQEQLLLLVELGRQHNTADSTGRIWSYSQLWSVWSAEKNLRSVAAVGSIRVLTWVLGVILSVQSVLVSCGWGASGCGWRRCCSAVSWLRRVVVVVSLVRASVASVSITLLPVTAMVSITTIRSVTTPIAPVTTAMRSIAAI